MKKIMLILMSCVLSSCITHPLQFLYEDMSEEMDSGLAKYHFQHIDNLIDVIGFPNSVTEVAGRTVYGWSFQETISHSKTETVYSASGVHTVTIPQTSDQFCIISVEVNENEAIRRWHWDGTYAGCKRYAEVLR